ncbi:hypothetical protein F4778DRAFT_689858 [Xylariomycetidae sp. FL2044]|nr:hypothetical protein F4778DRAFT_689858 [Xylariomycetidae sp. FL2044]
MAKSPSTVGVFMSTCSSSPHSSPSSSPADQASLEAQRLSSVTDRAGNGDVVDRLVSGGSRDHTASVQATLDGLAPHINSLTQGGGR